ncbi:Heat-inducible transcription repressor HrcA [Clostridium liquoris]|uniref:Heat-inducible transcription repressor HrcA n=1 Tax=Clostridium liquoris TaxID=1289519 RepID=A0A2T0B0W1_9CLOT|nr:heat-inducible transcriptional repressor HrcA [Clostridium liquoris]PRR77251.1 Heat-inducible transcription repressor HrcA [Clostridium liquoris]
MEMDKRKIRILQAIIQDYINTAEPVGSRTIAKKYDLGISSATIRNEMSDLEDMGYLEQLHSSSGRKPSDKGYRLYVDNFMQLHKLSPLEEHIIKTHILNSALYEADKVIKQATTLLAELTGLTSIVKSPSSKKSCIKAVQLMNIDSNNILSVIITDTSIIRNNVIRLKQSVSTDVLAKLSNILNARLNNLTVEEINLEVINNLRNDFRGYEDIFNAIIPALYESLNSIDTSDIYLEGTTNIFNYPEYNDIEKAKNFLSLIDNKDKIKNLINSSDSITIKIGEENFIEDAKDCTVISAVYSLKDKPLGTIGVIGPTRMPYSKVISILEEIVNEVNNILNNEYND